MKKQELLCTTCNTSLVPPPLNDNSLLIRKLVCPNCKMQFAFYTVAGQAQQMGGVLYGAASSRGAGTAAPGAAASRTATGAATPGIIGAARAAQIAVKKEIIGVLPLPQ